MDDNYYEGIDFHYRMQGEIINLIEVSRIISSSKIEMLTILNLSLLKLLSTINQIIPFAILRVVIVAGS